MTELIDQFQPKYPKGRGKALTLLVLTSIGTGFKVLLFFLILVEELSRRHPFSYMNNRKKFIFFVIAVVAITGIVNVFASFRMFRQKLAGFTLYIVSHLVATFMIVWGVLASTRKLYEAQQIFLVVVLLNLVVYISMYLSNRKYYSKVPALEDQI